MPQKMARGFKFQILEVEGFYCLCRENKGTDQLHSDRGRAAICAFAFAYVKIRASHDVAYI